MILIYNIVESMIKNSKLKYNLIIALPPNISHVMDRQRKFSSYLHGGATKEIREKSFQDIIKYYNFYGYNDIMILEGNSYEARLKNIINKELS